MSVSTNGVLAYGFDLGIEDEKPLPHLLTEGDDGECMDFEDFLAKEAGLPDWDENAGPDYWKKKQAIVKACPIELVTHCSLDYPMYIVAIQGTAHSASRGYAESLTPEDLVVPDDRIEAARQWCEAHQIEWQEPKWLLASLWA